MTKVDIFSGFLGAGKTTLMKKLISEAFQGEQIVIIENEFGEIGIDGGFLRDSGIQITEMNSGCICCSLVGDFSKALKEVIDTYHPSRILIEPSGVGKLSDVVNAVKRADSEEIEIVGMVTVADANKCKVYMKNFGEFYNNQIETASTVVLSRTANISEEKLQACVAMIREKNASATVITTPWDQLDGSQILAAIEHTDSLTNALKELEIEQHHHEDGECDDPECSCHHHHHHDEDDNDTDEGEHEHHHHHHDHDDDGDEDEHEHHHHHDDDGDEDEHEHHHHHHHHDDDEECDDPDCSCHHHHDGEEHHHHHHHADEVFSSWGVETAKIFTKEEIESCLKALDDDDKFGVVLRAKGIVAGRDGWIHFDHVPGEADIRSGSSAVTGRLCVIGSKLKEDAIRELFGV